MNPHKSICPILKKYKTYYQIRKFLKSFGMTRGEQNEILDLCEWKPLTK